MFSTLQSHSTREKTRRWIKSLKCCSNSRFKINNRCIIVKNTSLHVYFGNAGKNIYPRCVVKGKMEMYVRPFSITFYYEFHFTVTAKWMQSELLAKYLTQNIRKDSKVTSLPMISRGSGWGGISAAYLRSLM